ncbi:MAG TPA: hypothetical protein VF625_18060 [Longimicrobium sp.]|jgi:hypothetical protein
MPRPTPVSSNRVSTRAAAAPTESESSIRFGTQNLAFFAAAAVAIVLGFVMLAGGSTVAAPLLLVLGYGVLIPLGIVR